MVEIAQRPVRAPTHPGAVLREDVLPALGLSVTAIARHLGVTRQQLHRVLSEQSGISPEMALRLGKLCGNGEMLWMRMQEAHDLWHARRKLGAELDRIPTLRADAA
ncbi:HigA family addiction module antitoxin [Salinarimonas ramus]|uniref:Transcriptional regulator n=1 Tax=Salinarimonas ramus TaxID=690164 RepID=A0A917V3A1_9HYPH|nr:HigA family addiction module antitoxin [Salinarimonas ramus]GGK28625.1 transcriptional regulator [Salinarimonas ramus]